MLEQKKPRRTIAERIRKKEPKPKKAKTPKKREVCRVEIEPGESRIMWCPRPILVTAPAWLADLARYAKLPKDSLSLSFMQLRPESEAAPIAKTALFPAMDPNGVVARILSEAFPVPGMGHARYACTEDGFAIIPAAGDIPSGTLVACRRPASPRKDAKTGAVELLWQPEQKPQR